MRSVASELGLEARFDPRQIPTRENASTWRNPHGHSRPTRPSARATDDSRLVKSLYVANLPWRVTSEDLHALFSPFGVVNQSTVIADRKSGRSRGFGFIDMAAAGAAIAINQLDGTTLDGRHLTVRPARSRR